MHGGPKLEIRKERVGHLISCNLNNCCQNNDIHRYLSFSRKQGLCINVKKRITKLAMSMRMMARFTRQTGEKALDLPEIGTLLKWVIYVRLRGEQCSLSIYYVFCVF